MAIISMVTVSFILFGRDQIKTDLKREDMASRVPSPVAAPLHGELEKAFICSFPFKECLDLPAQLGSWQWQLLLWPLLVAPREQSFLRTYQQGSKNVETKFLRNKVTKLFRPFWPRQDKIKVTVPWITLLPLLLLSPGENHKLSTILLPWFPLDLYI